MAMEVSKGDVLAGFQQLLGGIMIPALQQQEVTTVFLNSPWIINSRKYFIFLISILYVMPYLTSVGKGMMLMIFNTCRALLAFNYI